MPAKAKSGRSSLSTNHTTSFFLVSGFGSGAYSAKAVGRDQATVFRLEPAAPVRRGGVADIGDGIAAGSWRRWHAPAHHGELAIAARGSHDGRRIVGEYTGHRRQVADVSVQHPEKGNDGRLVRGDAVEITHSTCLGSVIAAPRRQLLAGPMPPSWAYAPCPVGAALA